VTNNLHYLSASAAQAATILIIEDDPNNLALITDYLEEEPQFTVLVAEDGESGVQRASYARPDLILLDVLIPGIDGFETCRKLKAAGATSDIPVIFMTALTETEHKLRGFAAGAVDYITKPFRREDVLARVSVHLHIRELRRKLQDANASLERKVGERTAALAKVNSALQAEIAERRQIERELRQSEQRFRMLVENLPVGVFIKDRDLAYVVCSPSYARGLGIEPEAIPGTTDYDYFPREIAEKYRAEDRKVMDRNQGEESDEEYLKEGQRCWVHKVKKPLTDDARQVTGILGVVWDITVRRNLEEQLRQAVKLEAIGILAGGIAHDFNNLMTVVLGYCDLLLLQSGTPAPIRGDIEQIKDAGERAASLTRRLLTFSRKQVLQPKVLDLNYVVADLEKMLRRLIGEDIELLVQLDPALGMVSADPSQLEQVIVNLAVNARDAMPDGGRLTIETANVHLDETYARQHVDVLAGDYVQLALSDTGMGMDAATLAHMFEPFFTTKEVDKGTGLGLATVYGVVRQSGGSISVSSESGQGATFNIYLPRVAEPQEVVLAGGERAGVPQGQHETVLLVEDDAQVRSFTSTCLRVNGYVVLEASHGHEALGIFQEHGSAIELLITDVIMPGMGGRRLVAALRALSPTLKVLYISGYTAKEKHVVLDAGAAFLQKPFTPPSLLHKIRELLV